MAPERVVAKHPSMWGMLVRSESPAYPVIAVQPLRDIFRGNRNDIGIFRAFLAEIPTPSGIHSEDEAMGWHPV
jgi:hypothetical protein